MFKSSKKKRLQEANENVQKNQSSVNIIPNAADTLEKTSKNWKHVNRKAIIDKINYASSKGTKYAAFYDSYISEELIIELQDLGYKVTVKNPGTYTGPSFEITW